MPRTKQSGRGNKTGSVPRKSLPPGQKGIREAVAELQMREGIAPPPVASGGDHGPPPVTASITEPAAEPPPVASGGEDQPPPVATGGEDRLPLSPVLLFFLFRPPRQESRKHRSRSGPSSALKNTGLGGWGGWGWGLGRGWAMS